MAICCLGELVAKLSDVRQRLATRGDVKGANEVARIAHRVKLLAQRLEKPVQGDSQYAKDLDYIMKVDHKWYNLAKEISRFLWPGPEGVERFLTPSNMRKDVDPKDVAIANGWARDSF